MTPTPHAAPSTKAPRSPRETGAKVNLADIEAERDLLPAGAR